MNATARRRARLAAQRLDGRSSAGDPVEVATTVVGLQAQDEVAAALAVRVRSRGLVADDVAGAVAGGSLVLTWSLRGTRHLHAAADVRWLVGLLGPVLGRPGRRARQLGIDGTVGDEAVRRLRAALAHEGPLSRAAVKERLAPVGVDPAGQAAVHVLQRAALEGVLCVLPDPAGKRYVLLDDWVPAPPAAFGAADEAAAALARRYLAAFGPATPADFAAWSGLGMVAARRAWTDADGPREAAAERGPLRLLGPFDPLLLGYADRSPFVAPEHARLVNAGGGMVKATVIDDGRVVATWARRGAGIEVRPFRRLGARQAAAVEEEAADVGRFLGTASGVTVAAPATPERTRPGRGR